MTCDLDAALCTRGRPQHGYCTPLWAHLAIDGAVCCHKGSAIYAKGFAASLAFSPNSQDVLTTADVPT